MCPKGYLRVVAVAVLWVVAVAALTFLLTEVPAYVMRLLM